MAASSKKEKLRDFKKEVWGFYKREGRDLPWRHTHDPYRILVSEVMLQQTQVDRVVPKYRAFLSRFPSLKALSQSHGSEVLSSWSGLGYNRRARMLHRAAQEIRTKHRGRIPRDLASLEALPGIGPYTARAVMVFAWNEPHVLLETNTRSAVIHHFFRKKTGVHDREVLPILEATLDSKHPREWHYALMDYGSYLKRRYGNPAKKSAHHVRQKPFLGSRREARGRILRLLTEKPHQQAALRKAVAHGYYDEALQALLSEGFVRKEGRRIMLS